MKRFLILAFLITTASHASSIKKWVDENGQVHYGDTPPMQTQTQNIKVTRPPSDPGRRLPRLGDNGNDNQTPEGNAQPNSAENPDASNGDTPTPQYTADQKRELCEKAKKDLNTLNTTDTIRLRGSDGKTRVMTDAEKLSRKSLAQKDINEFCQ